MLDGMRRASQNWIGRTIMALVMGFIILSFAIWGIGDIFRGFGSSTVASVGGQEITSESLRFSYQTALQRLQQQYRQAITNEQARAFGLDKQVLGRLIAEAALDQRAKTLGLAISDEEIAKAIQNDKTFAGPTGKFDITRFNDALRDAGLSEQGFLREQRKVYLRQEIADALVAGIPAPRVALEAINRYRNETRAIEYVVLPEAMAGEIPAASPDDLQKFYDARKTSFRSDEYRKVVTLVVTPSSVADASKVTDADARTRYERVKGERFGTSETRHIQQIVFPNEQEAKDASQKIKGGETFEQVAGSRLVDLGTVAKKDMIDSVVADAAFALPAGGVSDPVKGQFGEVLLRVEAVNPESVRPYDEVAGELKQEIALERARKSAQDVRDKVEDERTSGKTLAEAAATLGLQVRTIDSITASGIDANGQPVADLPERDAFLKAVFQSDVGVDNDTLNTRDGGFIWFEIANVEQARERSLEEVKADVEKAWREDETLKRLTAKADELVEKIKGGAPIEDVAKGESGLEVKSANDVKRVGTTSVPPGVVARVFAMPVGGVGSAAGEGLSRVVFKINDSATPTLDMDAPATKGIVDQLTAGSSEEILTQYITKLQTDLGVRINDAAVNTAIGGGDPNSLF